MAYLGHAENCDFMQVDGHVFVFVLGRWCRYCSLRQWFDTIGGRIIRWFLHKGLKITLKGTYCVTF